MNMMVNFLLKSRQLLKEHLWTSATFWWLLKTLTGNHTGWWIILNHFCFRFGILQLLQHYLRKSENYQIFIWMLQVLRRIIWTSCFMISDIAEQHQQNHLCFADPPIFLAFQVPTLFPHWQFLKIIITIPTYMDFRFRQQNTVSWLHLVLKANLTRLWML